MSLAGLTTKEMYFIIGALRRVFGRSELRREVLREVRVEEPKILKNGKKSDKPRISYKCQLCGASAGGAKNKSRAHIQVDHIVPVIPPGKTYSDMTFDEIILRLFTTKDNLQAICSVCHEAKTAVERAERVRRRKEKKENELSTNG